MIPGKKTKMKTFRNKSIDDILDKKLVGVPDNAVIIEIAMGSLFEGRLKTKYKL